MGSIQIDNGQRSLFLAVKKKYISINSLHLLKNKSEDKLLANKNLLLENIIEGILQKKGQEIVDINLAKINSAICDHFIICHAESGTQVGAIADSVEKLVRENLKTRVGHREGVQNATWILLDYSDIVVHIFQREVRDYYRLEELWGDADIVRIEESYN